MAKNKFEFIDMTQIKRGTNMSFPQTFTLDEIKQIPVENFFQSVSVGQKIVSVKLPNGSEVLIQPKPLLKSLPVLRGVIPQGWKEAIYNEY